MEIELSEIEGHWDGSLKQPDGDNPYVTSIPMHADIKVRDWPTGTVRIVIHWPTLKNTTSESVGTIDDGKITWTEQKRLEWDQRARHQPSAELGSIYIAELVEPGVMVGAIAATRRHQNGCTFELKK